MLRSIHTFRLRFSFAVAASPALRLHVHVAAMSTAAKFTYNTVRPYDAPHWAKALKNVPTSYVELCMRPTPIHRWNVPGVPTGFQLSVKRDDMTGSTLSGNKVRKLEFLLSEAVEQGCDSVITCGSYQSNHCRATAIAARQLGMDSHLFLRLPGEIDASALGCSGNLLLDRLCRSRLVLVPSEPYLGGVVYGKQMRGLKRRMEDYAEKLRSEGHKPYLIPVGGSNTVGSWGYIEEFKEMVEQGVLEHFDDLVMATGSGGTLTGVTVGNYLTGSKVKVHGVCVCDTAEYFYDHVDHHLEELGVASTNDRGQPIRARDLVDIFDGYKGKGYGLSTDEELAQLLDAVGETGVSLDPVYTLKALRGLLAEMAGNPGRFAGSRVLFIHTGGIFGLYDGGIDELLKKNPSTNQVFKYSDIIADA